MDEGECWYLTPCIRGVSRSWKALQNCPLLMRPKLMDIARVLLASDRISSAKAPVYHPSAFARLYTLVA